MPRLQQFVRNFDEGVVEDFRGERYNSHQVLFVSVSPIISTHDMKSMLFSTAVPHLHGFAKYRTWLEAMHVDEPNLFMWVSSLL